jgi:hypothetical protein
MPPFVHQNKNPGDLIRSADWNLVGNEIVRLGADKISRAGEESLEGPLTVRGTLNVAGTAANGVGLSLKGELSVGTPTAGAAVRILRRQEDGKAATDGALVLGTDSASSGALRMGYYSTYSWLQGQGQQAIALNPHGGNVGIGTGTTAPSAKLHVEGDLRVAGALSFGKATRQMLNLWGTEYGLGVQSWTTYLRTGGNFAFYKGGSHTDEQLNAGGGTALATLASDGTLTAGALRFGNNSLLTADQGGSIELGGDNGTAGKGTPYIDFHFGNARIEDYNVRLINDGEKRLSLAGSLRVTGNVGVGVDAPVSRLAVAGGASVGAGYAATAAPGDGLIVQGNLGIGVAAPVSKLHVNGDTVWSENIGQRFILHTRAGTGDFLQITADDAVGNWQWGQGITMRRGGSVGIGTNQPSTDARLHVAGGALRMDANQEILFADNGQIRSADNNHRILFRRTEDTMELREYGRIVFSPGSTNGAQTAKAMFEANGTFKYTQMAQMSTREIKREIAPLDQGYAADLLDGLEPVRYRMIEDPDGDEHLGFVAEEVPDAIAGADHRTIHPGYIVAVLTRVVKEQQRRLNELTHRLEEGRSHG